MQGRFIRVMRWGCWAIITVNIVLSFLFANQPIPAENLVWGFVLALWLLGSSGVVAILLPILYWRYAVDWRIWIVLLGLMIFSGMVLSQMISLPGAGLTLLMTLLHLASILMISTAMIVLTLQRDAGLTIITWMSIVTMWLLVFVWLRYGNIFELALQPIQPDEPQPVTLIFSLIVQSVCFVPLAFIGFCWWTIRLIYREGKRISPLSEA